MTSLHLAPDSKPKDGELGEMSFLAHLDELRKRLIISIVALIVGFLVCWSFAPAIFELIQRPLISAMPDDGKLAFTRLTAPFFLYMKVAFFAGIFLSAPVVVLQIWLFIRPGLYARERRYAIPFLLFSSLFFIAGGYFGYRVVLPLACDFFIQLGEQFQDVITIDEYFAFAARMMLGMGLVFETPILIFFLARLGLVTPGFLLRNFKYAVLIIFVIAAIITPTPDMVTQSALAVPMIVLYLLGIAIAKIFGARERTEEK